MLFQELVTLLERGLSQPLPGALAHAALAPRPRRPAPAERRGLPQRAGAALVLLYPRDAQAHLVLTQRPGTLLHHAGQISLPGGAVEPGESAEQAALREAHEEIGLDLSLVRIAGLLTPIDIPVSGFQLQPVVGLTDARPRLTARAGEVERILEPALASLADPRNLRLIARQRDGLEQLCPSIDVDGEELWGATAMVLAELLCLLGLLPATPP